MAGVATGHLGQQMWIQQHPLRREQEGVGDGLAGRLNQIGVGWWRLFLRLAVPNRLALRLARGRRLRFTGCRGGQGR